MQHILRATPLAALSTALLLFLLPQQSHAATITITMVSSQFSPKTVTINPGDTVTWINQDSMQHTATEDSGLFDSGTIQPGQQFSVTFNNVGAYNYHCRFHGSAGGGGMAGTITVTSGGTTYVNPNVFNPNADYFTKNYTNSYTTYAVPNNPSTVQSQVQSLLSQIAALQGQLGGSGAVPASSGVTTNSASCPLIGGTLRYGSSGDDVRRLQQFLARDASVYPEGQASGFYGSLTQTAVQRWQTKYHVVSSGTPATTGYGVVGPRTAAAISILCTTGSYGGVSGPSGSASSGPVGGYISVTPISGAAPLPVNVTATVNTVNSCQAAQYQLDFGDGTAPQQIPVSAGVCNPQSQTYPHTYQYGGSYKIILSAGTHQTSATVTITGPAAPPPPVYTPGLPNESFSANPTSGASPLTVTFSGTVNSNDKGFCLGGCASILDFGDGTSASVNLPAAVGGWLSYSVTHKYTQVGGYKATLYQGAAGPNQPSVGTATIVVNPASSGGGSTSSSYSYQAPVLIPSTSDPLSFTAQFDLPSSCTGYDLSWGDGSQHASQSDGGSSCAQSAVVGSASHTYAQSGTYTIVLKRGSSLSRTDDISVQIKQ